MKVKFQPRSPIQIKPCMQLLFSLLLLPLVALACNSPAGGTPMAGTAPTPGMGPASASPTLANTSPVVTPVSSHTPTTPAPSHTPTTPAPTHTPTTPAPSPTPTMPAPTATALPQATVTPVATSPAVLPTIEYFRANVDVADPGDTIQLEWSTRNATRVTLYHMMPSGQFGSSW